MFGAKFIAVEDEEENRLRLHLLDFNPFATKYYQTHPQLLRDWSESLGGVECLLVEEESAIGKYCGRSGDILKPNHSTSVVGLHT